MLLWNETASSLNVELKDDFLQRQARLSKQLKHFTLKKVGFFSHFLEKNAGTVYYTKTSRNVKDLIKPIYPENKVKITYQKMILFQNLF